MNSMFSLFVRSSGNYANNFYLAGMMAGLNMLISVYFNMMCSNDDKIKSIAFYVHAIMRHNTATIRDTT